MIYDGNVVYEGKSDYYIVRVRSYFVILQWQSGPYISKGDSIYGNLLTKYYQDITVNNFPKDTRVYIIGYWNNLEDCFNWLKLKGKYK